MTRIKLKFPTPHIGQQAIYSNAGQYNAVCCGRRYGKTKALVTISAQTSVIGKKVGIFTPTYDQVKEPWDELVNILEPVIKSKNKSEKSIRLINGGGIDIWTLSDNPLAGRGREYNDVLIDEAAFTKDDQMRWTWEKAIKPTLLTTKGRAWAFSTPNGINSDNFFYQICHDPSFEFKFHHAPTSSNPYVPPDELEKIRLASHPLVWKQEYLAEFVDWGSSAFFSVDNLLANNLPVEYPEKCDGVFAVMDCSVKSGSENDGTAVLYCAVNKHYGNPLVLLDWEIHSIDAAMLESLAPKVMTRCDELARQCGARSGSLGVLVEDAAGGSVLIQQARARGWPVQGIESKLTAKGKDERAMIAGGPVYRGEVKLSRYAFDKICAWKGQERNHLLTQITTFRVGDKDAYKRADDLLDTFTYAVITALCDANAL